MGGAVVRSRHRARPSIARSPGPRDRSAFPNGGRPSAGDVRRVLKGVGPGGIWHPRHRSRLGRGGADARRAASFGLVLLLGLAYSRHAEAPVNAIPPPPGRAASCARGRHRPDDIIPALRRHLNAMFGFRQACAFRGRSRRSFQDSAETTCPRVQVVSVGLSGEALDHPQCRRRIPGWRLEAAQRRMMSSGSMPPRAQLAARQRAAEWRSPGASGVPQL